MDPGVGRGKAHRDSQPGHVRYLLIHTLIHSFSSTDLGEPGVGGRRKGRVCAPGHS